MLTLIFRGVHRHHRPSFNHPICLYPPLFNSWQSLDTSLGTI